MTTLKVEKLSRPFFDQLWIFTQSVNFSLTMFRTCIPKRDKNSEWFFRKCSKFQKSPKNRNFPKQTSRLTLERYYHTLEFPETLAQQALTPSKWILLLITFVYCLFIGNSLCGHWTRIWPSRYDREHLTTVNHGKIQPNRAYLRKNHNANSVEMEPIQPWTRLCVINLSH